MYDPVHTFAAEPQDEHDTPDDRLARWADQIGISVEDIKAHTESVKRNINDLQEAKNAGATDTELVAIATQGTP